MKYKMTRDTKKVKVWLSLNRIISRTPKGRFTVSSFYHYLLGASVVVHFVDDIPTTLEVLEKTNGKVSLAGTGGCLKEVPHNTPYVFYLFKDEDKKILGFALKAANVLHYKKDWRQAQFLP